MRGGVKDRRDTKFDPRAPERSDVTWHKHSTLYISGVHVVPDRTYMYMIGCLIPPLKLTGQHRFAVWREASQPLRERLIGAQGTRLHSHITSHQFLVAGGQASLCVTN